MQFTDPHDALRYHVSGAIERGEGIPIVGIPSEHSCGKFDDDGRPFAPDVAECGICGYRWCDRCDPTAVSALAHCCHGRGYSTAPIR